MLTSGNSGLLEYLHSFSHAQAQHSQQVRTQSGEAAHDGSADHMLLDQSKGRIGSLYDDPEEHAEPAKPAALQHLKQLRLSRVIYQATTPRQPTVIDVQAQDQCQLAATHGSTKADSRVKALRASASILDARVDLHVQTSGLKKASSTPSSPGRMPSSGYTLQLKPRLLPSHLTLGPADRSSRSTLTRPKAQPSADKHSLRGNRAPSGSILRPGAQQQPQHNLRTMRQAGVQGRYPLHPDQSPAVRALLPSEQDPRLMSQQAEAGAGAVADASPPPRTVRVRVVRHTPRTTSTLQLKRRSPGPRSRSPSLSPHLYKTHSVLAAPQLAHQELAPATQHTDTRAVRADTGSRLVNLLSEPRYDDDAPGRPAGGPGEQLALRARAAGGMQLSVVSAGDDSLDRLLQDAYDALEPPEPEQHAMQWSKQQQQQQPHQVRSQQLPTYDWQIQEQRQGQQQLVQWPQHEDRQMQLLPRHDAQHGFESSSRLMKLPADVQLVLCGEDSERGQQAQQLPLILWPQDVDGAMQDLSAHQQHVMSCGPRVSHVSGGGILDGWSGQQGGDVHVQGGPQTRRGSAVMGHGYQAPGRGQSQALQWHEPDASHQQTRQHSWQHPEQPHQQAHQQPHQQHQHHHHLRLQGRSAAGQAQPGVGPHPQPTNPFLDLLQQDALMAEAFDGWHMTARTLASRRRLLDQAASAAHQQRLLRDVLNAWGHLAAERSAALSLAWCAWEPHTARVARAMLLAWAALALNLQVPGCNPAQDLACKLLQIAWTRSLFGFWRTAVRMGQAKRLTYHMAHVFDRCRLHRRALRAWIRVWSCCCAARAYAAVRDKRTLLVALHCLRLHAVQAKGSLHPQRGLYLLRCAWEGLEMVVVAARHRALAVTQHYLACIMSRCFTAWVCLTEQQTRTAQSQQLAGVYLAAWRQTTAAVSYHRYHTLSTCFAAWQDVTSWQAPEDQQASAALPVPAGFSATHALDQLLLASGRDHRPHQQVNVKQHRHNTRSEQGSMPQLMNNSGLVHNSHDYNPRQRVQGVQGQDVASLSSLAAATSAISAALRSAQDALAFAVHTNPAFEPQQAGDSGPPPPLVEPTFMSSGRSHASDHTSGGVTDDADGGYQPDVSSSRYAPGLPPASPATAKLLVQEALARLDQGSRSTRSTAGDQANSTDQWLSALVAKQGTLRPPPPDSQAQQPQQTAIPFQEVSIAAVEAQLSAQLRSVIQTHGRRGTGASGANTRPSTPTTPASPARRTLVPRSPEVTRIPSIHIAKQLQSQDVSPGAAAAAAGDKTSAPTHPAEPAAVQPAASPGADVSGVDSSVVVGPSLKSLETRDLLQLLEADVVWFDGMLSEGGALSAASPTPPARASPGRLTLPGGTPTSNRLPQTHLAPSGSPGQQHQVGSRPAVGCWDGPIQAVEVSSSSEPSSSSVSASSQHDLSMTALDAAAWEGGVGSRGGDEASSDRRWRRDSQQGSNGGSAAAGASLGSSWADGGVLQHVEPARQRGPSGVHTPAGAEASWCSTPTPSRHSSFSAPTAPGLHTCGGTGAQHERHNSSLVDLVAKAGAVAGSSNRSSRRSSGDGVQQASNRPGPPHLDPPQLLALSNRLPSRGSSPGARPVHSASHRTGSAGKQAVVAGSSSVSPTASYASAHVRRASAHPAPVPARRNPSPFMKRMEAAVTVCNPHQAATGSPNGMMQHQGLAAGSPAAPAAGGRGEVTRGGGRAAVYLTDFLLDGVASEASVVSDDAGYRSYCIAPQTICRVRSPAAEGPGSPAAGQWHDPSTPTTHRASSCSPHSYVPAGTDIAFQDELGYTVDWAGEEELLMQAQRHENHHLLDPALLSYVLSSPQVQNQPL